MRALPLLLPITNQPVYTRECDRVYTIHLQSFIICKLISNNDFLKFVYSNESEYSKKKKKYNNYINTKQPPIFLK